MILNLRMSCYFTPSIQKINIEKSTNDIFLCVWDRDNINTILGMHVYVFMLFNHNKMTM